jgi:hypothetical protein
LEKYLPTGDISSEDIKSEVLKLVKVANKYGYGSKEVTSGSVYSVTMESVSVQFGSYCFFYNAVYNNVSSDTTHYITVWIDYTKLNDEISEKQQADFGVYTMQKDSTGKIDEGAWAWPSYYDETEDELLYQVNSYYLATLIYLRRAIVPKVPKALKNQKNK